MPKLEMPEGVEVGRVSVLTLRPGDRVLVHLRTESGWLSHDRFEHISEQIRNWLGPDIPVAIVMMPGDLEVAGVYRRASNPTWPEAKVQP